MQNKTAAVKIASGDRTQPGENVGASLEEMSFHEEIKKIMVKVQALDVIAEALKVIGYEQIYAGLDYVVFSIENVELVLDYGHGLSDVRVYAREKGF